MLIKKLTGFWGRGVECIIKTQQRQNKQFVKLLMANPTSHFTRHLPALTAKHRRLAVPAALPSVCEVAPPTPGKWLKSSHSITVLESGRSGARMHYWLYIPNTDASSPLPLVVMLHGCAQTATQFAQSTRMNQLADKKGFAVLYPQQTTAHNPGRCWRWYSKTIQEGGAEVTSVVAIINSVSEKYGFDKGRIYIAGISAGAAMANIIALNHPHLIAAVGMHSGSVFGAAETPMAGYAVMKHGADSALLGAIRTAVARVADFPAMPAILIHGQQDKMVRPVNLAQLTEQFRELNQLAGYDKQTMLVKITDKLANSRSGNGYQTCEYYAGKKMLLKVCEVSDLGHAWSGGDESANFSNGKGPDASRMMWNFFARHRRPTGAAAALPDAFCRQAEGNR